MKSGIHIFSGLITGVITFSIGCALAWLISTPLRPGGEVNSTEISGSPPKNIEFKPMIWLGQGTRPIINTISPPEPVRPTKPFCNDKRILPVWKQIQRKLGADEWKHGIKSFGIADCSKIVEVRYFNLDGRDAREILAIGGHGFFCGATGNCSFWIFRKVGSKYREILEASDYVDINDLGDQVLKTKSRGFNDILVKNHLNASDTAHTTYKFDGRRYRISSDLVYAHDYRNNGELYWHFITYKKWSERGW